MQPAFRIATRKPFGSFDSALCFVASLHLPSIPSPLEHASYNPVKMSMSHLVSGGAGCGPSNPLQNIGKRFAQDRGAQQDTLGVGAFQQQQVSSFRSNVSGGSSSQQQQQTSFFNPSQQQTPFAQQQQHDAFDVSQLRANLPSGSRTPMQTQYRQSPASSMADLEASFRPAFSRNATIQAVPRAAAMTFSS